ncbi:MAG TPA: hypothetical protein DHW71_03730 [Gammaproteobacteria bacterium]|nr:hypothetical protein [Pseudomonadota bacterium]HBF07335.1 hypothetical protein [Gammaproteobacteria bacterium]HCK92069.1 hypothetical protein [Gammaproteobacteria bacterium]|tara:strand:+ start:2978 stop:3415 length:438 start_codon:yes stop_codon:yes gene_type:complete
MREFTRSHTDIKQQARSSESPMSEQQLDVLRVVYYVNIQYRKYKSALRALSVLLTFEKDDELALLATVFCYFSLKRYRKSANLLKSIKRKIHSDHGRTMYDYLEALILTEIGSRSEARMIYQRAKNKLPQTSDEDFLATLAPDED